MRILYEPYESIAKSLVEWECINIIHFGLKYSVTRYAELDAYQITFIFSVRKSAII